MFLRLYLVQDIKEGGVAHKMYGVLLRQSIQGFRHPASLRGFQAGIQQFPKDKAVQIAVTGPPGCELSQSLMPTISESTKRKGKKRSVSLWRGNLLLMRQVSP